jgi:multiple sugar transport system permease protein
MRKWFSKDRFRRDVMPWFFLVPAIISFAMFKYYPILLGFFVSFFKVDIVNLPGTFIGFDNYIKAFQDKDFLNAIGNTFEFLGISLLINFWVPIFLATLINEVRRGKTFVRTMYFIPAVAPGIAMSVLWKYIWQPDYGLANYLMKVLNLPTQKWLNDPVLVKWCMQFPGLIIGGGLTMVIYLAALQDVPEEQHESALLDGAGFFRRIFSISLPQIMPIVSTMLILAVIDVFNMFDNVQIMTGGGPSGHTETMVLYAYEQAYTFLNYGYAITLSCLTFLCVFVLTAIQMSIGNDKVIARKKKKEKKPQLQAAHAAAKEE